MKRESETAPYNCPVCDYPGFDENPLDHTFDICSQCGVEFGYDDAGTSHAVLRERWESAGKPFWRRMVAIDPRWNEGYDLILHPEAI